MNPHQVTRDFEQALASYTGAPYVVCVNSCTMALTLAVAWQLWGKEGIQYPAPLNLGGEPPYVEIPARTYVSVPMAIMHAGGMPTFRDEDWEGYYQLAPLPVWDSARYFSSGMYGKPFIGGRVCVSFHASKTLGLEQGGAILLDDPEAAKWLRRARFDGRSEGVAPRDDKFDMVGWHCYMNPSTAAQGLLRLHSLPRDNFPLTNDDYPDLSKMEIFK